MSSRLSRGWPVGGITDSSVAEITWYSGESCGLPGITFFFFVTSDSWSRILTPPFVLVPPWHSRQRVRKISLAWAARTSGAGLLLLGGCACAKVVNAKQATTRDRKSFMDFLALENSEGGEGDAVRNMAPTIRL